MIVKINKREYRRMKGLIVFGEWNYQLGGFLLFLTTQHLCILLGTML